METKAPTQEMLLLAEALAEAQKELKNPAKDRDNPYFNSRYATLDALQDASRAILAKHGLSVIQVCQPSFREQTNSLKYEAMTFTNKDGQPEAGLKLLPILWELRTILLHSSGAFIDSVMPLVMVTKGPQQFGSELTYMRRYAYAAILSMTADEDDDANSAQGLEKTKDVDDPWKKEKTKKKPAPKDDVLDQTKSFSKEEQKAAGGGPKDNDQTPDELPMGDPVKEAMDAVAKKAAEIFEAEPAKGFEEMALTPLEQVRQRLKADGNTEAQYMAFLHSHKLTRSGVLVGVDNRVLESTLNRWETVQQRLKEAK